MRGKLFLAIILAAAVAALAGVLVAVAGADNTATLPDLTAPELIAGMADPARAPDAISGDISWTNELFGGMTLVPDHAAQAAQSPLLAGGSGRFWAQDEKVRLDSQGRGGDQVLVADGQAGTIWTYTFADDTAHLYEWDVASAHGVTVASPSPSPEILTPERVSAFLQAAARFMAVDVTGQTVVAGRSAYVLTMTPAADDTALGKVEAAIDGRTYVPLRLDVVAKGHTTPTLSFAFTRVSYDPVEEDVFAFTPPDGAKIERDTIDLSGKGHDGASQDGTSEKSGEDAVTPGSEQERADAMEQIKKLARTALLSRAEAAELVDFPLAWARDYAARDYAARDFRWAYVFDEGMPVNALGSPVFDLAGMMSGIDAGEGEAGGDAAGGLPPDTGPAAVLLYGEGFGSIVLAQTKTSAGIGEQLKQLPEIVDTVDLGGTQGKAVATPLGSVVIWERDGVTLVAAGMVPKADLVEFVTSVR